MALTDSDYQAAIEFVRSYLHDHGCEHIDAAIAKRIMYDNLKAKDQLRFYINSLLQDVEVRSGDLYRRTIERLQRNVFMSDATLHGIGVVLDESQAASLRASESVIDLSTIKTGRDAIPLFKDVLSALRMEMDPPGWSRE